MESLSKEKPTTVQKQKSHLLYKQTKSFLHILLLLYIQTHCFVENKFVLRDWLTFFESNWNVLFQTNEKKKTEL